MKFTVYQIAKKLEISRSNLQQYLDRGFINPSISRAKGKGTRNYFSLEDIYCIRIFQRLAQIGFSQSEAAEYSQDLDLSKLGNKGIDWVKITYDEKGRKKVIHSHYGSVKLEILKGKPIVTVINFKKLKEEIDALFEG